MLLAFHVIIAFVFNLSLKSNWIHSTSKIWLTKQVALPFLMLCISVVKICKILASLLSYPYCWDHETQTCQLSLYIFLKLFQIFARHNHLRCPMMGEVSLET